MCETIAKIVSKLVSLIGLGRLIQMSLNQQIEKLSKAYLHYLIQKINEFTNNSPAGTKWNVYSGDVAKDFRLSFFYRMCLNFDTSEFYKKVLLRLKEQGHLEQIDDSHFIFDVDNRKNSLLFER